MNATTAKIVARDFFSGHPDFETFIETGIVTDEMLAVTQSTLADAKSQPYAYDRDSIRDIDGLRMHLKFQLLEQKR